MATKTNTDDITVMDPAHLTFEYIDCDGVKLHAAKAGARDRPPVVLLHGFPEFWYSWRHQIPALVDAGFSVVAPDLRGYNLSDKPAGREFYHLDRLVSDVACTVRSTGHSRAHIIGHDWGGILSWAFAGRHAELLDRLVIMNAPHMEAYRRKARRPPQLFMSWYVALFCLPGISEFALSANNYAAIRDMFSNKTARKEAFSSTDIDKYVQAIAQPGALTAALNWYQCGMLSAGGMIPARQARVNAPALIIWGELDPALHVSNLDGLEEFAPHLHIHRIPQVSHWVQCEAANEVNATLIPFLKGEALPTRD